MSLIKIPLAIVILIIIVLSEYVGVVHPIRGYQEQFLRPFLRGGESFTFGILFPFKVMSNARNADQTIRELESKYAQSLAEVSQLEGVKEENEELRSLLVEKDRTLEEVLIVRPIFSHARLAIDAGSTQGVAPGMVVLVDRTVVGVVTEASAHFALVAPLAELTQQALLVVTESGYRGLIKGDSREILLTEVPSEAQVQVGEKVITLGQPGVARDLFIGTVAQEVTQPESPTKNYRIEQPVSLSEARMAELLLPTP